jgi:predicted double-glycine peptidase
MEDYFDEEAELYIDYQEPTFPRTIEEMDKEREMKLKYNTINIFDIAKEDNLDITSNEEARQLLEENRKINEKYKPSAFGFGGINSLDESVEEETESEETEKYEPTEKELEQGYYVADLGDGATYTAEILEKPFEVTGSKELGSKELDMPNDRQFSYYDCGDAVVITALARFGIEPNPENLIDDLGTTQDWGTEPKNIKSVLESYGLTVEMKPMTFQDIKNYIDNDIAVILDIQAWHDEDITYYDYTDEWEDGHYVNVYGYTETTVKLKDPSSMMNRELTWVELQRRWHDVDREGNKFYNMGIAYWGLPIKWGSDKTEAIG